MATDIPKVIRVLIVDDHPVILDGLAGFLDQQPDIEVVGRYTTPAEALAALDGVEPDVAMVDVKVGGAFGFAFGSAAKDKRPLLSVDVFMTGFDDDVFVEKAFAVGGLGFILKSEPLSELVSAVRTVASGERYVSPSVRSRVRDSGRSQLPVSSSRLSLLTPREREIVRYVSMGKSAKEISAALNISAWTVTNHKANIMAKLDIHNQVGLARFAVETGLVNNI